MGVPCIEYLELLKTYEDQKGYKVNLTQYVKYKFVEGITNFSDLVNYVEKWSENPYQASTHSTDVYAKHFPVLNNSSEIIANKILIESKIT
jgi:hypothetical protein